MNEQNDLKALIEKYKNDMKKYAPISTVGNTAPIKVQPVQQMQPQNPAPTADDRPLLNNERFLADYNPPSIPRADVIKGQLENLDSEGTIQITVSTARGSTPVPNANVSVSAENADGENDRLIGVYITDINGKTPVINLATVSAAQSKEPGVKNPYAAYNVRAEKDGFYISEVQNVPIYDGIASLQRIELVPLPENYSGSRLTVIENTGPISLN